MLEALGDLGLAREARQQLGVDNGDHLDRYFTSERQLRCTKDAAVTARADLLLDAIATLQEVADTENRRIHRRRLSRSRLRNKRRRQSAKIRVAARDIATAIRATFAP